MSKTEAVLFVCSRYPELNLVLDAKDVVTNEKTGRTRAHAGKEVHFVKMGYQGQFRGELLTNDPEVIEFVRAHEWYGRIIKEEAQPSAKSRVAPETVSQGTRDSGQREPQAPAEAPEVVGKAKVGLRGRPKKLVEA